MEFECWQEWAGQEVAFFVATFCDLPQYERTIGQNLNGPMLNDLYSNGMLAKGLARAGVSDFGHQQRILAAVARLYTDEADELNSQLHENLTDQGLQRRLEELNLREKLAAQAPLRPRPPGLYHGRRVDYRVMPNESLTLCYAPASKITLEVSLPSNAHESSDRRTPRICDGANEPPFEPPVENENVIEVTKQLRNKLSRSVNTYENLRSASGPLYSTISRRKTESVPDAAQEQMVPRPPLDTVAKAKAKPGSKPMNGFQNKTATPHHPGDEEMAGACVKIQAKFRGSMDRRKVEEMKTKAPIKHGPANHAVGLPGHEEMDKACVKIQAKFRGSMDRRRVEEMKLSDPTSHGVGLRGIQKIQADRQEKRAKEEMKRETTKMAEERKPWVSHSILDTVSDAMFATGHMNKEMHDMIEQETHMELSASEVKAATKLQACQRQRMAVKKVHSLREERKSREKIIQNEGGPCTDEETAASIKIQAVHRRKQAQKKVAEIKQHQHRKAAEKEEPHDQNEVDAAKKIQHHFRKRSMEREMRHDRDARFQTEENMKDRKIGEAREKKKQREEEEIAAKKIQAIQRRKAAMREVELKKAERKAQLLRDMQEDKLQEKAAVKIQAITRGRNARSSQVTYRA